MTDDFRELFELMNRWRHLPKYRLEGNVQPLVGFFLPGILSSALGKKILGTIIPEFPLRKGTLDEQKENTREQNYSYNVDYVAFGADQETAYLVELKTDMRSIRESQLEYLEAAREKSFRELVVGVKKLAGASKQKQKYVHLLSYLASEDIQVMCKDAYETLKTKSFSNSKPIPGWTEALNNMEPEDRFNNIEIVYIQPKVNTHIDFKKVAEILEEKDSDLGNILAEFIRGWAEEAGSPTPILPPMKSY